MKFIKLFEEMSGDEDMLKYIEDEYVKYNNSIEEKFRAKNTKLTEENLLILDDKIVIVTADFYKHMESHNKPTTELGGAPGSYFTGNAEQTKECIQTALKNKESQKFEGQKPRLDTYIWRQVDCGSEIGVSVVQFDEELKKTVSQTVFPTDEQIKTGDSNVINNFIDSLENCQIPESYQKYFYNRGNIKEGIIIKDDVVKPTNYTTVVCGKLTDYQNKPVFLIYTAYPDEKGGPNGNPIPGNRMLFPQNGFYFSVSKQFFDKVSKNQKSYENNSFRNLKKFKSFLRK